MSLERCKECGEEMVRREFSLGNRVVWLCMKCGRVKECVLVRKEREGFRKIVRGMKVGDEVMMRWRRTGDDLPMSAVYWGRRELGFKLSADPTPFGLKVRRLE